MQKEQLEKFRKEVSIKLDEDITEVKLAHCISNYNFGQFQHSIYIENSTVMAVPRMMGSSMQIRYGTPETKTDAMLTAMAFVMVQGKRNFSFSFGGR